MRVGVAGILHESNTFIAKPTTLDDFRRVIFMEGEAMARLGEMACLRFRHARRAPLAERHLHRGVTIGLGRLDLRDAVVPDVEHGHRNGAAVVGRRDVS